MSNGNGTVTYQGADERMESPNDRAARLRHANQKARTAMWAALQAIEHMDGETFHLSTDGAAADKEAAIALRKKAEGLYQELVSYTGS